MKPIPYRAGPRQTARSIADPSNLATTAITQRSSSWVRRRQQQDPVEWPWHPAVASCAPLMHAVDRSEGTGHIYVVVRPTGPPRRIDSLVEAVWGDVLRGRSFQKVEARGRPCTYLPSPVRCCWMGAIVRCLRGLHFDDLLMPVSLDVGDWRCPAFVFARGIVRGDDHLPSDFTCE